MHIAYWSPAWPLEKFQNGIITYVHWMKTALEARGHRVSVFTPEAMDQSEEAWGERVHRVRLGLVDRAWRAVSRTFRPVEYGAFYFPRTLAAEIMRVHAQDPIDILEMEESFGWFAGVQSRISLPVLVKLHGPACLFQTEEEIGTPFGQEKIEREGRALKRASTIISPSTFTLSQTISYYGLSPACREHIVNPIAVDPDTPLWNLDSCDPNLILFVGRFDLRKGADVMLEAFKRVWNERPDLKLVFVGPDRGMPGPDGRLLKFKEYLQASYPPEFHDRVDFRGRMPNREIEILRTKAMMTVVAARLENQSYALLEAMLQRCPVVCTDGGGCPESIVEGVSGLLAKAGDPESFADKMRQLLDNRPAAAMMGEGARRYVLAEHSVATVAEKSIGLYQQTVR